MKSASRCFNYTDAPYFVLLYFFYCLFPTIFRYHFLFMLRSFSYLFLHVILYIPFFLLYAPPFLTVRVSVLDRTSAFS
jgi:hypothetical protein